MELLKELCEIHAPSGNEDKLVNFIVKYINDNSSKWVVNPELLYGESFQNNILLIFGKPKTIIFSHMDSVGFTVRYENQLVPIGGPEVKNGYTLNGQDDFGPVECELIEDEHHQLYYDFGRGIQRGTTLTFKCKFMETSQTIQSCALDNRVGVFASLKIAETLKNGIIAFSTWEEHGGGSVPHILKYVTDRYPIRNALIADVTWSTDGINLGDGAVISLRDRNIPRKKFIDKITSIIKKSGFKYQLEVEGSGSSDGREVQQSPYPIDWCFLGIPQKNPHTPYEIINKSDLNEMISIYKILMDSL
ncbi:MAG TPA: M20/M25/M40 family metallo-hydrolase [Cyclobacteriaceae bacterium]